MLGILFVVAVIVITYYHHTLLLPLFIGLSTTLKGLLRLLTPKFLVLLFKNSLFLKIKQLLIKSSTRFVVLSHKPWRHRMRWIKSSISKTSLNIIKYYLLSPLWLRTAIALGLLFATASSSYVVIALLIIPQPILNWVKKLILTILRRSGITHLLSAIWKFLVPTEVQHKWYMHAKWTMGRHQVNTARRLRELIFGSAKDTLNLTQTETANRSESDRSNNA